MTSRQVNFGEFVERRNAEAAIDITMAGGTVVHIPPPEFWPPVPKDSDDPDIEGKTILGDQWERFVAGGGTNAALGVLIREELGATSGESEASSNS